MTVALVTGITGQDGSYLAESLVADGYEVHGIVRDAEEEVPNGTAHRIDLEDATGLRDLITELKPDEFYNLAAVSSVFRSWEEPTQTARINGVAVAEMLAAVKKLGDAGHATRFIQASSAEIFGSPTEVPQTEDTPVRPTSPYGAAKAYGHALVGTYRSAGVFASSIILYNHESPRRPEAFVTRKITAGVARISAGLQETLTLGNLLARRDWGWAPDYGRALRLAASADLPGDFIIATGVDHSVEDFVRAAFARVGIEDWRQHVQVAEDLLRTGDAPQQVGNASKAREALGWRPTKDFDEIVAAMVDNDVALLRDR